MRKLTPPILPILPSAGSTVEQGRIFSVGGVLYFDTGTLVVPMSTQTLAETLSNKTLVTPALGTPASGNLSNCTVDGTSAPGFRGIPQISSSASRTCILSDAGKEIYHPSGAGAGDTFTIPANSSVAYEIGTAITFTNMDSNVLSIAITTDTMYLAGVGTTGTRSLAQYGTAVAVKKTSTTWLISGVGLS